MAGDGIQLLGGLAQHLGSSLNQILVAAASSQ
jgi:hypothetical protein